MIIGLTGGLGSGKSTVLRMFRKLGARTADADALARRALEPGGGAYRAVRRLLGKDIVRPDGSLDRVGIARRVFRNPALRRRLERLVHPLVVRALRGKIRRHRQGVLVLDIPLLYEVRLENLADRVVVVWAPKALRLRRLLKDGRFSRADILRRMRAQMPLEEKRRRADRVIDNAGTFKKTKEQVWRIWRGWSV